MGNLKNTVVDSLARVFFINMYFDRRTLENNVDFFLGGGRIKYFIHLLNTKKMTTTK